MRRFVQNQSDMSPTSAGMRTLWASVRGFCRDARGSIVILAAFALPLLFLAAGGALDFARYLQQKQSLQEAADAAVLAGAKGLSLSNASRDNVDAVIKAVVTRFIGVNADNHAGKQLSVASTISDDPLEVSVEIEMPSKAVLTKRFGVNVPAVKVSATARIVGQPNICVLGLDGSADGTISLEREARVTGKNCAVFSNSNSSLGIIAKRSSQLMADVICSAGGYARNTAAYSPEPMVDCPTFADPLAGRPEPSVGACTYPKLVEVTSNQTLSPGVYCGGLAVRGSAEVKLLPGIYVFKDGPLMVQKTAGLHGTSVGLFFTGLGARLHFQKDTTISLEAPETGEMAGILIFASKSVGDDLFRITSDNARNLLGTIYLPSASLHVDATKPVADQSAYTAIVAKTMKLFGGPHLVLNTDYHLSTVPVPGGIKGVGQPIRLSK